MYCTIAYYIDMYDEFQEISFQNIGEVFFWISKTMEVTR